MEELASFPKHCSRVIVEIEIQPKRAQLIRNVQVLRRSVSFGYLRSEVGFHLAKAIDSRTMSR